MNNLNKILIVISLLLSAALVAVIFQNIKPEQKLSERYIEKIETKNPMLRAIAIEQSSECVSGSKECQINEIYLYVVKNYNYYSDPRSEEYIQPVNETINIRGGDCEDLTILLNSLLESIGINTYFVMDNNHSFSLACGINMSEMNHYILEDLKRTYYRENREHVSLKKGYYYYYILGNSSEEYSSAAKYKINLSSNVPVEVHIIDSEEEYFKAINNEDFMHYSQYYSPLTTSYEKEFFMDENVGLLLYNGNNELAEIDFVFGKEIKYYATDLENLNITTYKIKGADCIALESTAGKNGYPGITLAKNSNKTAIDPVTGERINLY